MRRCNSNDNSVILIYSIAFCVAKEFGTDNNNSERLRRFAQKCGKDKMLGISTLVKCRLSSKRTFISFYWKLNTDSVSVLFCSLIMPNCLKHSSVQFKKVSGSLTYRIENPCIYRNNEQIVCVINKVLELDCCNPKFFFNSIGSHEHFVDSLALNLTIIVGTL